MESGYLHIPLNESELSHLDQLFRSYSHPNVVKNLAAIDGFVTALASGPEDENFPMIMDEMLAGFPTKLGADDRLLTQELLLRHLLSTDATLHESPEEFDLMVGTAQLDESELIGDWCAGYWFAVELSADVWAGLINGSDLLLPIELYSRPELVADIEQFEAGEEVDRRALVKSIAVLVYAHWAEEWAALEAIEQVMEPSDLIAANEPFHNEPFHNEPFHNELRAAGRNDPCPCGSGKKYKKCCLSQASNKVVQETTESVRNAMVIDAGQPADIGGVRNIAANVMTDMNQKPIDDFHGLSPSEMDLLLNHPFDASPVAEFSEPMLSETTAPLLLLWQLMAEAISDTGLKATAKGNLPRTFCQEARERLLELDVEVEHGYLAFSKVNKEADFPLLELLRLMAQEMKLIARRKGHFVLTKAGQALKAAESGAAYRRFFQAYAREFLWGFDDRYEELATIQYGFMFTLYLLSRYGDDYKPVSFYGQIYLRAFPMLLDELDGTPKWHSEELYIENVYVLRSLERFAERFGLATMRDVSGDEPGRQMEVKATPLLDQLLRFKGAG